MSFRPNRYGPLCPLGEFTVLAAGTAIQLSSNLDPVINPNAKVDASHKDQYAYSFEDIIINSPATNAAGLYLVTWNIQAGTGGKGSTDTIVLYIPKSSPPISLKKYLGGSRFNPNALAIDADQNNDKAWAVGIVGT